jgi:hypothetical protein
MRARRLHGGPLLGERRGECALAVAQRGFDQRQLEEVALRVAAAEAVRDRGQRPQQVDALRIFPSPNAWIASANRMDRPRA